MWMITVSIVYKHSNTVFFKRRLILCSKTGSVDMECWYLSLCNATVRFHTVLKFKTGRSLVLSISWINCLRQNNYN